MRRNFSTALPFESTHHFCFDFLNMLLRDHNNWPIDRCLQSFFYFTDPIISLPTLNFISNVFPARKCFDCCLFIFFISLCGEKSSQKNSNFLGATVLFFIFSNNLWRKRNIRFMMSISWRWCPLSVWKIYKCDSQIWISSNNL